MPSKIVFQETILSAIKNCLPRRQFWVPSKIVARKIFFCVCARRHSCHTKKSCARKKKCARARKKTVEGAGTQQLTKNNVFRKKLVYLHIHKNSRCAIFVFRVEIVPNRTQVGPRIKKTKKRPNDGLEKNRGSTSQDR